MQHYKMPCTGEGIQLCYLIDRGNGEFEYLYDEIEGFQYRWGFSHQITVTRTSQQPAMADASTFQYRLASLIEQQRVPAETTFELSMRLDGAAVVEMKDGSCALLGAIAIDTSEPGCDALRNRDMAVFRHHATEQRLVPVSDAPEHGL